MRKAIAILFLIRNVCFFAQNPNGLDTAWVSSFGGSSIDFGRDLKETSDKGFIIGGTTSTFGSGNTSFYIIKTNSIGKHVWSKSLGSSSNDILYSVDVATDKGYFFSGTTNSNIQNGYDGYLIKTDSLGNILWSKNYGGADWDFIYNSCLMPDGGLLLCGQTSSGSHGDPDGYLIRTDSNGDTLWTRTIGTSGDDTFRSIAQKNDRIYVVGSIFDSINNKNLACIYKLDFSGQILNQDFHSSNNSDDMVYLDLFMTSNGEILLCGKRGNTTLGNPILRKIDTTSFSQIDDLSNSQNFHLRGITEGNNYDVYTVGLSTGGQGGYAANFVRYDSNLGYLHNGTFGGPKDEEGFEIIKTSRGYAFIGSTNSYGNQNGSPDENVYLVIFNIQNLVNEYFILLTEFQDTLSPIGLKENKNNASKVMLYPNPFNSIYTLRFPDSSFDGRMLKYLLYDNQGKLVDEEFVLVTDRHIILNRKNANTGVYTYRLMQNTSILSTGKISVE